MLILRKILLYDFIYYLIVFLTLIYVFIFIKYVPTNSAYTGDERNIIGVVTSYNIDGDRLSMNLRAEEKLVATYTFKTLEEKEYFEEKMKLGITVNIRGNLEKPLNNTIPNTFNYKRFLNSRNIYWIMRGLRVEIIDENVNWFYGIKNYIVDRIDRLSKSNAYIKTFILGERNDIDQITYINYQKNGVAHLFALSGMHVNLLAGFILLSLRKIKLSENKSYLIVILFLFFYAALTNYTASILRATLFFSLLSLNKIMYTHIKTINILLLVGCILLIRNPLIIYDLGFQYSFVISFGLVLSSNKFKGSNYIMKLVKVSTIAFLFSIPITLNNFYEINLLAILNNLVFVPMVTLIIYPLSLIAFIFPFLDNILYFFIYIMEFFNNVISRMSLFTIIIPKLGLFLSLVFYFILILMIIKNKIALKLLLIGILMFVKYQPKFDSSAYVYFLDVGQGDSTIIRTPYDREVIMIDTGGRLEFETSEWRRRSRTFDISNNIMVFMKSIGITRIDHLILTHGHEDHLGGAINLIDNFRVNNIVMNVGELNPAELRIINHAINIPVTQNEFNTELKINSLNNIDFGNENDNSLVLLFELYNKRFLIMGDATKKTENAITENVNADLLRTGHHGSRTSSGEDFLRRVNPNLAIISSGRNNRFNHPHREVIETIEKLNIDYLNTATSGTIWLKLRRETHTLFTVPP